MASRLGDILLQQGAVDADKLASALSDQKAFGGKLGRTLVDLGYVSEAALVDALAQQLSLDKVDLDSLDPAEETLRCLGLDVCERYGIFPVRHDHAQRVLWLATAEPDRETLQEVAQITQMTLEPVLASMSSIERAIRRHYYGDKGGPKKSKKGEALAAIPDDEGPASKLKGPPPKLPSSADAMIDPDAPPPPPPEAIASARSPQAEALADVPPPPPAAALVKSPPRARAGAAAPALQEAEAEPPEVEPEPPEVEPEPPEIPIEVGEPISSDGRLTATVAHAQDAFSGFEQPPPPPQSLSGIAPSASHPPDAVEELQRIVVRLEKIINAQGRAFRALMEILQEKGVVRRGELGTRTAKKP